MIKLEAYESMKLEEVRSKVKNRNQEQSLIKYLAPQQIKDVRFKFKFKT